jgi:glycine betaine/proline transport system ATP-binding protein
VRQNVGLGLEVGGLPRRDRRARIDEQLDLVGLTQWADRRVGELSGGMQQRVGLARAFATQAPILLMDEPFSALDPLIRTRLQDELLDLQARLKRTIIFVSHDLDEAFKLGNRIAIMEGGRIIQCGTPSQIYTSPANGYVADFVAHMNPLGVLRARDAAVPSTRPAPAGRTLPGETPLRVAMEMLTDGGGPILLTDEGRVVGLLTADSALAALTARRAGSAPAQNPAQGQGSGSIPMSVQGLGPTRSPSPAATNAAQGAVPPPVAAAGHSPATEMAQGASPPPAPHPTEGESPPSPARPA